MRINKTDLTLFLPDLSLSTEQLAESLSLIGHEAEVVEADEIEVKVFPNRGDVLSLRGLTRDLSALCGEVGEWHDVPTTGLPEPSEFFPLTISPDAKPFVLADHLVKITNYRSVPSPTEIKKLLKPLGLQSKELLIDLTNIIAYEVGMPLHAFDFSAVSGGMEIDLSREAERFNSLKGTEITLDEGLLIARLRDTGKVTDLLGTIGGASSSINPKTTTVLIQAAALDPSMIRRNSRATGLSTEASYRYQRGVDPNLPKLALERFIMLLADAAPDVKIEAYQPYERLQKAEPIAVDTRYAENLIGCSVPHSAWEQLSRLGFKVDGIEITSPSWRFDIRCSADVVEELCRIIGLNSITPRQLSKTKGDLTSDFYLTLTLKHRLAEFGFSEVMTYSFSPDGALTLQNPRSADQRAMRPSLKRGLLTALAKNPFLHKAAFFEVGAVFTPREVAMVGFGIAGVKEKQAKELADQLTSLCNTTVVLAPVRQEELAESDVKQSRVYFGEVPLENVTGQPAYEIRPFTIERFRLISKFPPIVRDTTLVIDQSVDSEVIINHCLKQPNVLLAEVVDRYESPEKLGEGKIALTVRILLQDLERTLVDEEATMEVGHIFHTLTDKVKFEIR